MEAFQNIPKKEAELTVVGAFNPQDKDIQPYVNRVRFTGMVLHSEISKVLQKADIFVFPSLGEGFSLSIMEAAAVGLPLVISENSGVADIIQNFTEGIIIPIQSSEAIQNAVKWFIDHPERIQSMGNAARKKALEYTWEKYYKTAVKEIQRGLM